MTVSATWKYRDSSSLTTSGSRASDSGVNPTTSQNSTEHTRRSVTGSPAVPALATVASGCAAATVGAAPFSACPQEWQNFLPGVIGSPHDGQPPSGHPHSLQNWWLASTDAPHC